MLCCQWELYSSFVPRPKTTIASLAIWDQMSKDVGDPLRPMKSLWFRIYLHLIVSFVPTHSSHSWFWSVFNRIDAESALRHICCLKLCLDLLWRLINFIQVVGSPSCIFHVIVPDEIRNKSTEYMEVQILDSLSARMIQQLDDVDHLRCSPTQTLRKVAI